jgi:hypothetical protein
MTDEDAGFLEREERRLVLVGNERWKLLANSLDRLSTACVAAGFVAPASALASAGVFDGISAAVVFSTGAWLSSAVLLHLSARRALGKLML